MFMKIEKFMIFIFFVGIFAIMLLFLCNSQPRKLRNEVKEGTLFCFFTERQYWCELTDFCVKDGYVYVLFGTKGVLNIYDDNGQYIKSYAFLAQKNGRSALYTDNDYVYLFDQLRNYYVLSCGEFISYSEEGEYEEYHQKIATLISGDEKRKEGDTTYYLKYVSIYRKSADNSSSQIIHRPWYLLYFQGVTPFVVIALWMIVILVLKRISEKVS